MPAADVFPDMANDKTRVRVAAATPDIGVEDLIVAWTYAALTMSLLFWYLRG
jgi:hypothetical protein